MPAFVKGLAKDKLLILFTLDKLAADAPKDFALAALFYSDLISVFDFSLALANLEENGLVLAIKRPFGQSYRISDEGQRTLRLFEEGLPCSERERVTNYICENRDRLRKETQVLSAQRDLPGGEIELTLNVAEGARTVFAVTLPVWSRDDAKKVRANWETRNADVFNAVCGALDLEI